MANWTTISVRRSRQVAARKVKDGESYFIRRHNLWFRPDAHGYTSDISQAGLYSAEKARSYLDVEGIEIVPIASAADYVSRLVKDADERVSRLRDLRHAIQTDKHDVALTKEFGHGG